jgi:lipopolysaccharide transport system ATP-binding protein
MLAEREMANVRQQKLDGGKVQTISGTGEAAITDIALLDDQGRRVETVEVGQKVALEIAVAAKADLPELVVGYVIKDRLGQPVYGTNTHHLKRTLERISNGEAMRFRFDFAANLGEGTYSVAVALHTGDTHLSRSYEWRDLALVFKVTASDAGKFVGVAWLPPRLEISR